MPRRIAFQCIGIKTEIMRDKFDLLPTVLNAIKLSGQRLRDRDILIISSKFIAVSEGRVVRLEDVNPSPAAMKFSKIGIPAELAEVVLREADEVLGGVEGFLLTLKNGALAPNAGVDKSNTPPGTVVLYPKDPFAYAWQLHKKIKSYGKHVGVVITDSRLLPLRIGTTGITIGVAGFEPVKDERGRGDLYGRKLLYTRRALADMMAAAAQLLMGEADEGIPMVILRPHSWESLGLVPTDRKLRKEDLTIEFDKCIYMGSLSKKEIISKVKGKRV